MSIDMTKRMSGTPTIPDGALTPKHLEAILMGTDIRSKSATEAFNAGPRFHYVREPHIETSGVRASRNIQRPKGNQSNE